jgi:penicillin-binding protein 1B
MADIMGAGLRIYTTLDPYLNDLAQTSLSKGIERLEKRHKLGPDDKLEGALASVDHQTGFIRCLIGGRDYSKSTFNRILNMRRQVGSTFKPLVYLTAFQQKQDSHGVPFGPGYPIQDAPWTLVYDNGKQSWSPKNYEKGFRGWIPLKTALSNSVNVATAKIANDVGIPNIIQTVRALGVESPLPHVPSLSLGVAELSPIELLRVYATLANHGVQNDLTVVRAIIFSGGQEWARTETSGKQVLDPGPVDLLTEVLQNVFLDGTAKAARKMGFSHPAAGKTGTTNNHRDAWFAGYTPQITSVVWIGLDHDNPNGKSKVNLTGAGAALPVWVSFMKAVVDPADSTAGGENFPESPYLAQISVDIHTGKLATDNCPAAQVLTDRYLLGTSTDDRTCAPTWPETHP